MYTPPTGFNCAPTEAILSEDVASNRVNAFRRTDKFVTLDHITLDAVGKHANPFYQLDLDHFLGLLRKFKADRYNGVRAHIACYPNVPNSKERSKVPEGWEGQLTLLFVPTFHHTGYDTGIDDVTQFWYLGPDGQVIHLPKPGSVPADEGVVSR